MCILSMYKQYFLLNFTFISLGLQLFFIINYMPIVFPINNFVNAMSENSETYPNFTEPKLVSINGVFYPTTGLKIQSFLVYYHV